MSFIEDVSVTDFMQKLQERVDIALDPDQIDDLVLTVSCIHRDISGNAPTVLAFTSAEEETINHEASMTFDQIAQLMEYLVVKAKERNIIINQYPISIIHQAMLNAFEQEVDTEELQQQMLDTVFSRVIMQGMASHLTITLTDKDLNIEYSLFAEIYADTSTEERALAQELGITQFTPSNPSKLVKLIGFSAGSFRNIME